MKNILLSVIAFYTIQFTYGQGTVESIRKDAAASAQQQDFTGAMQILEQGLQQYPDNLDILKDEAYFAYLGRDYQHSMQVGKTIVQRDDADVQCYQILGLTYKAIADSKDANKLYKTT